MVRSHELSTPERSAFTYSSRFIQCTPSGYRVHFLHMFRQTLFSLCLSRAKHSKQSANKLKHNTRRHTKATSPCCNSHPRVPRRIIHRQTSPYHPCPFSRPATRPTHPPTLPTNPKLNYTCSKRLAPLKKPLDHRASHAATSLAATISRIIRQKVHHR